jgi:hypothetical protein
MPVGAIQAIILGDILETPGTGYAVNDTMTLQQGSNISANITVTSITAGGDIDGANITTPGVDYFCQRPVTLVPSGSQPTAGTGSTVGIRNTTPGVGPGAICDYFSQDVGSGSGYATGDTGSLVGGNNDATYIVTGVDPDTGIVGFYISFGGSAYTASTDYNTITGGAQPGSGSGLVIHVTDVIPVSAGPTTGYINRTHHKN